MPTINIKLSEASCVTVAHALQVAAKKERSIAERHRAAGAPAEWSAMPERRADLYDMVAQDFLNAILTCEFCDGPVYRDGLCVHCWSEA